MKFFVVRKSGTGCVGSVEHFEIKKGERKNLREKKSDRKEESARDGEKHHAEALKTKST